ncbi:hypothetical protein LVD17_13865 [Fulvivirga ulvae]|uniref:hypothetical protein n=1 Tax=Fulvivirga ulvae TaxID=2904245 RepID=UPI001F1E826F|nr:hypothetical protein [Fulvivirga ulvae]UII34894.1 hypothetical protein LVD17_13865 [Fulvivirga ulvae]
MKNISLIFIVVLSVFLCCTHDKKDINSKKPIAMVNIEFDSICLDKKKLIETVLNNPDLIRYSRLKNVKKVFAVILIDFNSDYDDCKLPPYIQGGDTLEIKSEKDSVNTMNIPIYEFKEVNIVGDSAYIYVEFDISGAIAYGSLSRLKGDWVPDSAFIMGVR